MSKRILIIDDEPDLREVIKLSLDTFTTWSTEAVGSGAEGIERAQIKPYDAILLDVSMPDMDGLQVFEQLRLTQATQTIPVLLVTAKAGSRDRQKFFQMGIQGIIVKPFNPHLIAQEVANLLNWAF